MIVVTVSLSILNQMEIHLVQKLKGKLSPRSYPIEFERKSKSSFVSVAESPGLLQCIGNRYFEGARTDHATP